MISYQIKYQIKMADIWCKVLAIKGSCQLHASWLHWIEEVITSTNAFAKLLSPSPSLRLPLSQALSHSLKATAINYFIKYIKKFDIKVSSVEYVANHKNYTETALACEYEKQKYVIDSIYTASNFVVLKLLPSDSASIANWVGLVLHIYALIFMKCGSFVSVICFLPLSSKDADYPGRSWLLENNMVDLWW